MLDRRKNLVQKESMKIGYARVSTEDQNLDLQIEALTEAGCDRIITDQAQSGAKAAETRAGFSEALELLGPADLLVVWKLDRVGRSIADLIHLLKLFGDRGIEFRSLTDGIDTTTAGGRLVFHIMGALAEFERDLIQGFCRKVWRRIKKLEFCSPPDTFGRQVSENFLLCGRNFG